MKNNRIRLRKLITIALFGTIAAVFMLMSFPMAFIAPPFYKIDFAETIVLISGLTLGVVPAIVVELIKILLNLILNGTTTAGVGEVANFIMGCLFVLPATAIYRKRKTLGSLILGCVISIVSLTVGAAVINYLVLIPAYSKAFGVSVDVIISMGTAINASVADLKTLVVFTTVPFNIVKGIANVLLSVLLYKPMESVWARLDMKN